VTAILPILFLATAVAAGSPDTRSSELVSAYIEKYFETFPNRATEAGRHDRDRELEDLTPERLRGWLELNRRTLEQLSAAHLSGERSEDDRLDAELLQAQAAWEIHQLAVRRRSARDPLFWTNLAGNATVFLLVRDDLPLSERLAAARARVTQLPRLCLQARNALSATAAGEISPDFARIASAQARASAQFYRQGFGGLFTGNEKTVAAREANEAAAALEGLGDFLDRLSRRATGSPRLGADYKEALRIATGEPDPDALLSRATEDLAKKRKEAAAYGRSVWKEIFPGSAPPASDREALARLFSRIAADRAKTAEELIADYRKQVSDLDAFLRSREVVTLPDPLTLLVDRSPGYFVGQAVGGVYPAGPYAPEAKTLWFLPTPPDSATPGQRDAFFRDFNHHFNVMITPHEILPGHYLQLKVAARHPRKARALFPDGVYVEGWGTFCERLMLDLGWGGPLDRLAHLKKQMENIARAIVDVSVHTRGMPRQEVIRFVKEEALQDEQFASNMWTRAITTPTQITTYYLGYRQVRELYDDVKAARGAAFCLKEFMDSMLAMGPVPVARYRQRLLSPRSPRGEAPTGLETSTGDLDCDPAGVMMCGTATRSAEQHERTSATRRDSAARRARFGGRRPAREGGQPAAARRPGARRPLGHRPRVALPLLHGQRAGRAGAETE
jgi:uncharacterized protein (DUF885 family)